MICVILWGWPERYYAVAIKTSISYRSIIRMTILTRTFHWKTYTCALKYVIGWKFLTESACWLRSVKNLVQIFSHCSRVPNFIWLYSCVLPFRRDYWGFGSKLIMGRYSLLAFQSTEFLLEISAVPRDWSQTFSFQFSAFDHFTIWYYSNFLSLQRKTGQG